MLPFLCLSILPLITTQYSPNQIEYWNEFGQKKIQRQIQQGAQKAPKNVIFFLGDGMGVSAVTAGRIYRNQTGRSATHSFEMFESGGLVKTSSLTHHVTDSAAGAMALFGGRKVDQETLGRVAGAGCEAAAHVHDGIAQLALQAGMSVGFVTTTRITHATPAALFAKGVHRNMEYDVMVNDSNCKDIAAQLLHFPANQFKVMLGGGSDFLLPESKGGKRKDGRDVQQEWLRLPGARTVVNSGDELRKIDLRNVDNLMGTVHKDMFPYRLDDIEAGREQSIRLKEMVDIAVKILQRNSPKGYFLMVEGGMIDQAEHDNKMHLALEELVEFSDAVESAVVSTSSDDTLLLVTADHAHALALPGYLYKNDSIFSHRADPKGGVEERPTPGMMFATGPGYKDHLNYSDKEAASSQFQQPTLVKLPKGSHGGDDVGIWATGPYSWLFSGTSENTDVAYTIKYLLCLQSDSVCERPQPTNDSPTGSAALLAVTCACSGLSLIILLLLLVLRLTHSSVARQEKH